MQPLISKDAGMTILIIAFEAGRWGPARLVRPLSEAGFRVEALCDARNSLAQTRFLARHHPLARVRSARRFAARLTRVMLRAAPILVVPADEQAVACLHAVVRRGAEWGVPPAVLDSLTASLGEPARFDAMLLKSRTQDLARSLGVPVPEGGEVASEAAACARAASLGYPVYLKRAFGWAGNGVTRCESEAELRAAMAALPAAPGWRGALRRALGRDWFPTDGTADVQRAIVGRPAMYTAVALRGEMLGGFAGWARSTGAAEGPSTAVALGAHAMMERAAATMIGALGASGFISFDFMIEAATGRAYLLECNPRPNQVGHLGGLVGVDLAALLAAALRGRPRPRARATAAREVALFPQHWRHDPASLGQDDMVDVPWDDPQLLAAMTRDAPALPPPSLPDASAPGVLLFSLDEGRWGAARLARPLHLAGFRVGAVCAAGNSIAQSRFVTQCHTLGAGMETVAARLGEAMRAFRPALVIPCGERSVAWLQDAVRRGARTGLDAAALAVLARSLGHPKRFDAMLLKTHTQALARELGLPVPAGVRVDSAAAAVAAGQRLGFPVYLKRSFGWSGQGVELCRDAAGLRAAYARGAWHRHIPGRATLRRLLGRAWQPGDGGIDVQARIVGTPAMYCAVALEGRMLAGFGAVTRQTSGVNGPSTRVRLGPDAAMERTARVMLAALGATGFVNFDFMIEAGTGAVLLLECNPRPIPISHLGGRVGVDLCAALMAGLTGAAAPHAARAGAAEITLFPHEWQRDAAGLATTDGHIDLPLDDPGLLGFMVGTSWRTALENLAPAARPVRAPAAAVAAAA